LVFTIVDQISEYAKPILFIQTELYKNGGRVLKEGERDMMSVKSKEACIHLSNKSAYYAYFRSGIFH
jgi:hypothetical protein